MTAAGVASVSLCLARLASDERPIQAEERQSIERGLGWLAKNFAVGNNPGAGHWLLYYLVMLRRAGDLTQTAKLGDHDWRRELSDYLLSQRADTGGWQGHGQLEEDASLGTAFALLALTGVDPRPQE